MDLGPPPAVLVLVAVPPCRQPAPRVTTPRVVADRSGSRGVDRYHI
jgi:hypothetical protein